MDEVVPDTFATRLHTVMAHFSLDSAALAQGLSVDPAVVEAWLRGDQCLCAGSDALHQIADYFSNRMLGLKDINWFYKQFQQSGALLDAITAADMRPLLVSWLGAHTPEGEAFPSGNAISPTLRKPPRLLFQPVFSSASARRSSPSGLAYSIFCFVSIRCLPTCPRAATSTSTSPAIPCAASRNQQSSAA